MQNRITITDQLLKKLGLQDERKLKEKTNELLRLLELKSSGTGATINVYAKEIICIEVAAALLGITFDWDTALKLSGLRKTAYENFKRTFEKILEVNKVFNINEICMQLDLQQYQKKAVQFLEIYKYHTAEGSNELDFNHPQYAAMAIFQACKTDKGCKSIKSKLIVYSHLKPAQWNLLEQQWSKLLEKHGGASAKKVNERQQEGNNETHQHVGKSKSDKIANDTEDYEIWKKRMLDLAYAKLREKEHTAEC